jgi:hypothetical protein
MHIGTYILFTLMTYFFTYRILQRKTKLHGTWILNLERSKLESRPEGLTGSVFEIRQDGDLLKPTRYHIFSDKKKR